MSSLRFLFMGTGSSLGVPVIGCSCPTCSSSDPRDFRLRPGYLISYLGKSIWVDPSQDFRAQALKHHVNVLDGVLITHAHHDHTAGIDDLRVFNKIHRRPLPCLMSRATYEDLNVRYHYIFDQGHVAKSLVSNIAVHLMENDSGEIDFLGIPWRYFSFFQAGMLVHGFRLGNFAFLSDIRDYSSDLFDHLIGIKTLVISALRVESSDIHLNIQEAIDFSKRIEATNTWFTHVAHEVKYADVEEKLPEGFHLAYDGLEINSEI